MGRHAEALPTPGIAPTAPSHAQVDSGPITRYFFNGLTEEVKKVSVNSHTLADFEYDLKEDGESVGEWDSDNGYAVDGNIADSARRSDVVRTMIGLPESGGSINGAIIGDNDAGSLNGNGSPWGSTDRVLRFWYKGGGELVVYIYTDTGGERKVTYKFASGSSGQSGNNVTIYLGSTSATSAWTLFERNVKQDYEAYVTSYDWTETNGVKFLPGSSPLSVTFIITTHYLYLDDIKLSDSLTVEHNVLGPGVIGHILRNRTINSTSYAKTDRWFAYDQVGSVLSSTDADGELSDWFYQDAFGHPTSNYTTGYWSGSSVGWRHNTKEIDGDAGLTYMYQRWYDQTTGRFASVAPKEPSIEERYVYAFQSPTDYTDPDGRYATKGCEDCFGIADTGEGSGTSTYKDCMAIVNKMTFPTGNPVTKKCMEAHCRDGDVKCEPCNTTEGKRVAWNPNGWYLDGLKGWDAIVCTDEKKGLIKNGNISFHEVVVHEFAHECGWGGNHKSAPGGVPFPTGAVDGGSLH